MRAHFFQHVRFEGLGSMESWLLNFGYEISSTRFFEAGELPPLEDIHLLVVLGGPMSANDESLFPWLVSEKNFIRRAIEAGKPVLGICLGAQLIAGAAGARVYRNAVKEIGCFPIRGLSSKDSSLFHFPAMIDVFHWHGETFDLPPGAVRLAKSDACENQAFQLGRSVIGLQFHLETTPSAAADIVLHCRDELIPSATVQTAEDILSAGPEHYRSINRLMGEVLTFLMRNEA